MELEPHVLVGWFGDAYGATAFGLGGRASIPIVQNGFIKSINDSVGITFGLDLLFYGSCYYHGSCSATSLELPVAMQWNFFVAQHWSVFGEPGLYIYHAFLPDCPAGLPCPTATGVLPAFWAGGRYHISDSVSLTLRSGDPTFSFGGSFVL